MDDSSVLVVGAGPVGMTAAMLLASSGVPVTVIEKNATTANEPKAISLDDESLRLYQRAGIADDILEVIVPGTGTRYFDADGLELFHGGASIPFRHGFPFKNPFAQPDLERVLRSALESHPLVDLHYSAELVDVAQDDAGVEATVNLAGRTLLTRHDYLIAADGGRSFVRSTLGIGMTGRSHDEVWLVLDCLDDGHRERFGMHHAEPERPYVVVPGLNGRCRYEFYLYPGESGPTQHPSFDLIERVLAPHREIRPEQVERAVAYRFHGLNANEWQQGRVFLVGDAAHMMPPFAGQGLNSGLRDVSNLAWKIAAVLNDDAPELLLGTYQAERKPHAEATIRFSERLGRVVMTTDERIARHRDRVLRRTLGTAAGRNFFETMQYRPSPRITEGVVDNPNQRSLVGTIIGQPTVFDHRTHRISRLDDVLGSGWAVLGIGVESEDWASALNRLVRPLKSSAVDVPLDDLVHEQGQPIRIAIDVDGRLYSEFETARGTFVVVRPDRVVAAVYAPQELDERASSFVNQASSVGVRAV